MNTHTEAFLNVELHAELEAEVSRAREIAESAIDNPDADFAPGDLVRALNVLEASNYPGDYEFAEQLRELFPGLGNYDAKGNWIGPVRNENGWTA